MIHHLLKAITSAASQSTTQQVVHHAAHHAGNAIQASHHAAQSGARLQNTANAVNVLQGVKLGGEAVAWGRREYRKQELRKQIQAMEEELRQLG